MKPIARRCTGAASMNADEAPTIRVCHGPPRCDGADPESCEWCTIIDPFDDGWEAKLEQAQKGN